LANETDSSTAVTADAGEGYDSGSDAPGELSPIAQQILAEESAKEAKASKKPDAKANAAPPEGPVDDDDIPDASLSGEDSEEDVSEEEEPQEFELKVNGKTYKAKSVEELKAMAQRGLAVQQSQAKEREALKSERAKLEAIAEKVQAAQAKIDAISKMDVSELLSKMRPEDAKKAAIKLLEEEAREAAEMDGMSEREKALYLKAKEADRYKAKAEQDAQTREQREMAELSGQQQEVLAKTLTEALTAVKIPVAPGETLPLRIAAAIMRANVNKGIELTPAELGSQVKARLEYINSKVGYGSLSAEEFVTKHPELAEGVRAYYAKKAKGAVQPEPRATRDSKSGQFKKQKPDDFLESLERMKAEGQKQLRKAGINYTP
jgi:hypothetical protein